MKKVCLGCGRKLDIGSGEADRRWEYWLCRNSDCLVVGYGYSRGVMDTMEYRTQKHAARHCSSIPRGCLAVRDS